MTSSDFARAPRQQALLKAIFLKLMKIDAVTRAPELYEKFIDNVETDLTLVELLPLIPLAVQLTDTGRVSQYTIDLNQVTAWTTPRDRAHVFLPDREAILNLMLLALMP